MLILTFFFFTQFSFLLYLALLFYFLTMIPVEQQVAVVYLYLSGRVFFFIFNETLHERDGCMMKEEEG